MGDTESLIQLDCAGDPEGTSIVVHELECNRDVTTADELEALLRAEQLLPDADQSGNGQGIQDDIGTALREARSAMPTGTDSAPEYTAEELAADVFKRVSGIGEVANYAMQHLHFNGGSKFDDNSFIVKSFRPGGGGNLYLIYHHTHGICVAKESKFLTLAHYGRILAQRKKLTPEEQSEHENVERFMREMDMLESTADELIFPRILEKGHRKVVETRDGNVTSSETHPFYIMEHIPGLTISELIAQERKVGNELVSTKFVEGVGLRVLSQLGVLHDKYGITHRDIKPSNIPSRIRLRKLAEEEFPASPRSWVR